MKRLGKLLLLGCLSAYLGGCASVPMAPLSDDIAAKKFETVHGKSSVYLYRNEHFGGAIKITVSVNDKMIGQTAPYTYYLLQLEPGIHKFTCFAENTESMTLKTEPDQNYFVRQEVKLGLWAARCAVYETSAHEGKEGVIESKLAQSN